MTVEQRTGSLSFWKRDLHISARLLLREAFSEADPDFLACSISL